MKQSGSRKNPINVDQSEGGKVSRTRTEKSAPDPEANLFVKKLPGGPPKKKVRHWQDTHLLTHKSLKTRPQPDEGSLSTSSLYNRRSGVIGGEATTCSNMNGSRPSKRLPMCKHAAPSASDSREQSIKETIRCQTVPLWKGV